eukprot:scaffold29776_cov30-Tisochrysis_lutea.AAC.2
MAAPLPHHIGVAEKGERLRRCDQGVCSPPVGHDILAQGADMGSLGFGKPTPRPGLPASTVVEKAFSDQRRSHLILLDIRENRQFA